MSNSGLDNWKRDWPVEERALMILRRLVDQIRDHSSTDPQNWDAYLEAKQLIAELDGK